MRSMLYLSMLVACASAPSKPAPAPVDDIAYLAGTWSTSTTSYEDARTATTGVHVERDGHFQNGTWEGGTFVPVAGLSPGFVPHLELARATHELELFLDGAEEHARYTLEPPDRWKTETTSGEAVTVYYVRRGP